MERVMAQMEQLEQCVWTLTCQMDRMKSDERSEGKESARTGGHDKGRLPEEGMDERERRRKIYQEAATEAQRRMEAKEKMAKIATQAAIHAVARRDRKEMGRHVALAMTEEIWRRKKIRVCSEVATAASMAV